MKKKREIKKPELIIKFEEGEATEEEQKEAMLEVLQLLTEGYMEILRKGEDLSDEEKELAQKLFPKNKNSNEEQP